MVAPLATDLYLPGLTSMSADLGGGSVTAQASLTTFLISFSVGFLIWGPLSDRVGRRRLIIVGGLIFVAATAVCALSTNLTVFLIARSIEGLFGAAPTALSRAVVSDVHRGQLAAKKFASLGIFNSAAPVVAPAIGTLVLLLGADWRSMFWCVVVFGAVMVGMSTTGIPETRRLVQGEPHQLAFRKAAIELLRMPVFRIACIVTVTVSAVFFSYLGASESITVTYFGLPPAVYGTLVTANALSGSLIAVIYRTRLIHRLSTALVLRIGVSIIFIGVAIAVIGTGVGVAWLAWAGFFGLIAGNTLVFPTLVYLTQLSGASLGAGGLASAGSGVAQFLLGAAIGQIAVSVSGGSAFLLCLILAAVASVGLTCVLGTRTLSEHRLKALGTVATAPRLATGDESSFVPDSST
ncbi:MULTISPECIES: MFS transporter [unclassified Arthrobacter]|uniref:MFS transporter n=1 Tax=unclassified Arthrobacter TaxID=235627 RepID=UPI001C84E8EF|nr:MFS transporter [Arthrobacter sp. MAHUQ-56]